MPELPEVETIRRILKQGGLKSPSLLNKKITGAELYWARTLATPSAEEFYEAIISQVIGDIGRRGKFLTFYLTNCFLLLHLRMSGDVLIESSDQKPGKHHRLSLDLEDSIRFSFVDPRKFGRVWLVEDAEEVLGSLGPEPLSDEFTASTLHEMLSIRRRQIKPLLMDQSFIAGLGNIYTDEALYKAGIHPMTISNKLTRENNIHLWKSIRDVLNEGIKNNGASIDWVYRGGEFQNYFNVYGREGEECANCRGEIERIIVAQRSTHVCPTCQQAP